MHIAICGIDGSGKSTQAGLLAAALNRVRPGSALLTDFKREARRALKTLDGRGAELPDTLRAIGHAYDLLGAALAAERSGAEVVVWDRYKRCLQAYFTPLAVDFAWLEPLTRHVPDPDVMIVLDLTPELALARTSARDAGEPDTPAQSRWDLAYFGAVRRQYLLMAQADPQIHIVDAARPAAEVHAAILATIRERLPWCAS